MISSHKSFLRVKEDLYEILETFGIEYFYNDEKIMNRKAFDIWKELLNSDFVVKNNQKFLFCKKVEDLEFEMVTTDLVPIKN